jgi:hypothetical protein
MVDGRCGMAGRQELTPTNDQWVRLRALEREWWALEVERRYLELLVSRRDLPHWVPPRTDLEEQYLMKHPSVMASKALEEVADRERQVRERYKALLEKITREES